MSNDADYCGGGAGAAAAARHNAAVDEEEGVGVGCDDEESSSSSHAPEHSNPECAQERAGPRRDRDREDSVVRTSRRRGCRCCCGSGTGARRTCTDLAAETRRVLIKYFWDGQKLLDDDSTTSPRACTSSSSSSENNNDPGGHGRDEEVGACASSSLRRCTTLPRRLERRRRRKYIATLAPAVVVHIIWWSISFANDYFHLFIEPSGSKGQPRYLMSITMIFGSMIAGATSEGGAAIAFPVMTLVLGITPTVARDFSFMVQTVGMGAATFTILLMRVAVEWRALIHVTMGGVMGLVMGLELVAPYLPPAYAKMYFVVIWSSFAVGLYMLNRNHGRIVNDRIPNWDDGVLWRARTNTVGGSPLSIPKGVGRFLHFNWKATVLFTFGVAGGIFSAVAGSGIDICSFSALTLLFRVDEKVATPTSVVLMAVNAAVGFAYREFVMGGVEVEAWGFLYVCVPVVVVGAPLGSFLGSHFHRLTLAGVIYVIDAAQLLGALYVVQPWTTESTETPLILSLSSAAMFFGGLTFFTLLSHLGLKVSTTTAMTAEEEEEDVVDDDKQHHDDDDVGMMYERGETVDDDAEEESSEDDDDESSSRYSGAGVELAMRRQPSVAVK